MELAYEIISAEPDFEEITESVRSSFILDDIRQHQAIATWAENRFPPFGSDKKTILRKEKREETRETEIYFIGTPEKEIMATIKGLKTLGRELTKTNIVKAASTPSTPRRKCPKLKTLHRKIRDKREEINKSYEEEIEERINELKNLERILSELDPDILYDKHGGFLYDSSDE